MRSIKVLATDSTNTFLRDLFRENSAIENCCVIANKQTAGKGQMGSTWITEEGKNLTCSILLNDLSLPLDQQFKVSALAAIGVLKALSKLNIPKLNLKWPNDILAEQQKICGILIENILQGDAIKASIIGIGLNVNQTNFSGLAQASSLKLQTGIDYDLDYLLKTVVEEVEKEVLSAIKLPIEEIIKRYKTYLFRLEKPSMFEFPDGKQEPGIIKNISKQGHLEVMFEDAVLKSFEVKEVKMLY
ncbi:biotin--[acetyl-CoA-carboxylase] ligase [Mesonia aquimarina]|uniref:biotin--[acetyl-CoA-carboxylase] ligase n=1 Tax=Mesonia aquimarina TaxID=1504967 RepID=UPI000EF613B1|nr:biotin--[acetyl-CoA-carboxylase] ligase [Mesonia aquimarina]